MSSKTAVTIGPASSGACVSTTPSPWSRLDETAGRTARFEWLAAGLAELHGTGNVLGNRIARFIPKRPKLTTSRDLEAEEVKLRRDAEDQMQEDVSVAGFFLYLVSAGLFSALCVGTIMKMSKLRSSELSQVVFLAAIGCAVFALWALHGLTAQSNVGIFERFAADSNLILPGITTSYGVYAAITLRRIWPALLGAERVLSVFAERHEMRTPVQDFALTAREREVLGLLGEGFLKDDQIAEKLYISPGTARTHVRNLLRKTGLSNRRELMFMAIIRQNELRSS